MSKIRIEIDDDAEVATRLRALHDANLSAQRAYKQRYDALPEAEREGLPTPVLDDFPKMFEDVLLAGAADALYGSRSCSHSANCVVNVRRTYNDRDGWNSPTHAFSRGDVLHVTATLPIGARVINLTTSHEDGPNWLVKSLTFGTMNLVSPFGECVPLSDLRHATQHDLLVAFAGVKTKVDAMVSATLICKREGATFDGIRLGLFCEENMCAIAYRIEPTECDHPAECVEPVPYVDAPTLRPYSYVVPLPPYAAPSPMYQIPYAGHGAFCAGPAYRCKRCGRAVVKHPMHFTPAAK